MNVIGERVTVVGASDGSTVGKTGEIVLETAKTLVLASGGKLVRLAKKGSVFEVLGSRTILGGDDISGSLQDRLGRRSR